MDWRRRFKEDRSFALIQAGLVLFTTATALFLCAPNMEPGRAALFRTAYLVLLVEFLVSWAQATTTCPGYIQVVPEPCPHEVGGLVAMSTPWFCVQCHSRRPSRARHCHWCGTCVLEFDHHCPWIQNCCGKLNHGYFIKFCLHTVLAQLLVGHAIWDTALRTRSFGRRFLGVGSQPLRVVLALCTYIPIFLFTIFPAKLLIRNLGGAFRDVTGIERIAKIRRPFRFSNMRRVAGRWWLVFLLVPGMRPIGIQ